MFMTETLETLETIEKQNQKINEFHSMQVTIIDDDNIGLESNFFVVCIYRNTKLDSSTIFSLHFQFSQ